MLIAIDVSRAAREQKTGVEWYAFHLIQAMKKMAPEGVRVILYSDVPLTDPLAELPPDWSAKILRWPPRRLWTQIRLAVAVWRDRPDILFVPAHVPPWCLPRATKLVATIHDVAAARFPDAYHWFERWYSLAVARFLVRRRAQIIVPSKFTKCEIMSLVPAAQPEHIVVIPHGLDEIYFAPRTPAKIEKPYFIALGRLETKKQTAQIIEAFTFFKETYKTVHQLWLVGKPGFGYACVGKALAASPYRADIRTPGWISEKDLPTRLAGATALLFPSSYEGFGLPTLEAAALGVPVITTYGHSVEEIGGDAFWYTENTTAPTLAAAMNAVLSDEVERNRRTTAAAARARYYVWEASAAATWKTLLT